MLSRAGPVHDRRSDIPPCSSESTEVRTAPPEGSASLGACPWRAIDQHGAEMSGQVLPGPVWVSVRPASVSRSAECPPRRAQRG
eukprot:5939667-Pyramimonas_sp.AAC.1